MSISPSREPLSPEPETSAGAPRWIPILFVVLIALVGYLLYAEFTSRKDLEARLVQSNQKADQLAAQLVRANEQIVGMKGQITLTSQKLGITASQLEQARNLAIKAEKAAEQQAQALGQAQQENAAKFGQISSELGGAKTDIAATKTDLEATKARLERTVGDLGVTSGLVAHSREELEALKQLGERNIFEFNLHKAKAPQRVGPIQVRLTKVDPKRYRYSVYVVADDRQIEKRDKTANEPVQFYVRGSRIPYEIVVFEVSRDRITGYLSTPKDTGAPAADAPK
jgi:predicted  nucleic acid-binding Zn-ribbon protein